MTTEPLTITVTQFGGAPVLLTAGEIDLATSTRFAAALANALFNALAPGTALVLDRSAVCCTDAQGLRVLLAARHDIATLTTRLIVIPSPAVTRIPEITGAH